MTEMTSPAPLASRHHGAATTITTAAPSLTVVPAPEGPQDRRSDLRSRHARGLSSLMSQRSDLRGVNALADFVDDAVRWSA